MYKNTITAQKINAEDIEIVDICKHPQHEKKTIQTMNFVDMLYML